jgi:hypothetical protein
LHDPFLRKSDGTEPGRARRSLDVHSGVKREEYPTRSVGMPNRMPSFVGWVLAVPFPYLAGCCVYTSSAAFAVEIPHVNGKVRHENRGAVSVYRPVQAGAPIPRPRVFIMSPRCSIILRPLDRVYAQIWGYAGGAKAWPKLSWWRVMRGSVFLREYAVSVS